MKKTKLFAVLSSAVIVMSLTSCDPAKRPKNGEYKTSSYPQWGYTKMVIDGTTAEFKHIYWSGNLTDINCKAYLREWGKTKKKNYDYEAKLQVKYVDVFGDEEELKAPGGYAVYGYSKNDGKTIYLPKIASLGVTFKYKK